jgi:hypothetical protein
MITAAEHRFEKFPRKLTSPVLTIGGIRFSRAGSQGSLIIDAIISCTIYITLSTAFRN